MANEIKEEHEQIEGRTNGSKNARGESTIASRNQKDARGASSHIDPDERYFLLTLFFFFFL